MSTQIDVQVLEIDVPRACGSQVNGKMWSADTENASPAGNRLADSKKVREDRLRRGIHANTLREILLLGRKKCQQVVRFEPYIAGLVEDTMHGSAEMMNRYLNAHRKGMKMNDRYLIVPKLRGFR